MELLTLLNTLVGMGTLVAELVVVVLIVLYTRKDARIDTIIAAAAVPLVFALAFVGSALTLVYSMHFGIAPCPLCWMQRVFLYSQVVIFAVAYFARDIRVYLYGIALSVCGMGVALYQHLLQMSVGNLPCPASPEGVSCAKRFLFEFGHITFPWAAVVVFALIIVLLMYLRRVHLVYGGYTPR